jgi:FkbM family methyltransferase
VDAEDQYIGRHLAYDGEYGRSELERLRAVLTPDDNLLIVGAHIGAIAIPISHCCRSVTVIEANPRSFRLLEMNISINQRENVRAMRFAANDKAEELEFVASTVNSGGSKRLPVLRERIYFYDSPELIKVQAARLDEILEGLSFDVVHMDIEGSESSALRGMPRILSQTRALFVEFVPHHLRNCGNVTVERFLAPIEPYFLSMFVPSRNCVVRKAEWRSVLQSMYDRDESDDGILFSRSPSFVGPIPQVGGTPL